MAAFFFASGARQPSLRIEPVRFAHQIQCFAYFVDVAIRADDRHSILALSPLVVRGLPGSAQALRAGR